MTNGIIDLKGSDYKSSTMITHPSDWVEEATSGEDNSSCTYDISDL